MATYKTILTDLGRAKVALAIANDSFVNLSEMAVGDGNGNPTEPDPTQTTLVRETYRAGLNQLKRDQNNPPYVIAEMVIPSTEGGWTVREVGIFDNEGTLIAIANFPDTYKPELVEGSSRDLVIRIIIEVGSPDNVILVIDPSVVLASREWVTDNFSIANQIPGGTTGQILRKASNADGDFEWFDPTEGLNILVDTIEEVQDLSASQTIVNLAIATTDACAVFINGIRLRPLQYTINTSTRITLAVAATGGEKIHFVQNEPAAAINYLSRANNLSEINAAGSDAKTAARANLGIPEQSATITAVLQAIWPVGELYVTRRANSPDTWLGFGTWARWGAGKALTGFDAADAAFNALDKEGGSKSHTLGLANIPPHIHKVNPPATNTTSAGNHTHRVGTGAQAFLAYPSDGGTSVEQNQEGGQDGPRSDRIATTNSDGAHTHSVNIAEFDSGSTGGTSGSAVAVNHLSPYKVAYFWVRTA